MGVTDKDLADVLGGFVQRIEAEYQTMSEEELRERWYFNFDGEKSLTWNIYQFTGMLDLYKRSCRRWEEMHNGHCCVVERVRDKYLMPKIKEFEDDVRAKIASET